MRETTSSPSPPTMAESRFGSIDPPSLRINFETPSLRANCQAPPSLPLRVSCDAHLVYAYTDAEAKPHTSALYELRRRQRRCRSSACRSLGRSRTMKLCRWAGSGSSAARVLFLLPLLNPLGALALSVSFPLISSSLSSFTNWVYSSRHPAHPHDDYTLPFFIQLPLSLPRSNSVNTT
ncbi:hypothetical protein K438DRAFT_2025897 [Mycena galopus ATCC 62051]|nr:hypothetical protein K438DRAFT_2025897 [Mycena galopus ATCC 62051]